MADGAALAIGRYHENISQTSKMLDQAQKPFGFDSIVVGYKD